MSLTHNLLKSFPVIYLSLNYLYYAAMKRKKRCVFCPSSFTPNPRLGDRQVTCGSPECKRKQKLSSKRLWARNNKSIVRANFKDWIKNKPGYWKGYRSDHHDYAARNRTQTRLRKRLSAAGLQNRTDISQPLELSMQFLSFARFAKCARSLLPSPFVYKPVHELNAHPDGGSP